jgi:hypothetical protein
MKAPVPPHAFRYAATRLDYAALRNYERFAKDDASEHQPNHPLGSVGRFI